MDPQFGWLPLLAPRHNARVLEIGTGFDLPNATLRRAFRDVVGVRVSREDAPGSHDVGRPSELALPSPFDIIFCDGVLERIGLYEPGAPRQRQLEFLRKLGSSLKPNGWLVLGVRNRFSHRMFAGERDLSRARYTSIMPRWLADMYLRLRRKSGYRTYSYSAAGYRRLLRETGFATTHFFWADPHSYAPHRLASLDPAVVCSVIDRKRDESFLIKRGWKLWAKAIAGPALHHFVGDYLVLAQLNDSVELPIIAELRSRLSEPDLASGASFNIMQHPSESKTVIGLSRPKSAKPLMFAKTDFDSPNCKIGAAFRKEQLVHSAVARLENSAFQVPEPLAQFRSGDMEGALEWPSKGKQLSRILVHMSEAAVVAFLQKRCADVIRICEQIAFHLDISESFPIEEAEWQPPETLAHTHLSDALATAKYSACSQTFSHGDLSIENMFVESDGSVMVIDWEHLRSGVPATYDLFSFLLSAIQLIPAGTLVPRERFQRQFETAFFTNGPWALLFGKYFKAAESALDLEPGGWYDAFVAFLVLRHNYYLERHSSAAETHLRLVETTLEHRGDFIEHQIQPTQV